jgi:predicted Zn-dependent protease
MPAPITLAPTPVVRGAWVSPMQVDPFAVPLQEKVDLLLAAAKAALAVPGVHHADASILAVREEKLLLTSEGSRVHQIFFRVNPGFTATAVDRRRGRFTSRDHEVAPMLAGFEHVTEADLVGSAPAIAEEALRKLHAAPVVPGKKQVILAPSNLWLTIHESIGHSTELDRALGWEANFAGTSFLTPDSRGKLKIGSDRGAPGRDRTQPGGLATTGWDDEAVAAQRWDLVKDGVFVGWQTTRDLAAAAGEERSRGCLYADSYASVAFPRMPNVSLQPGAEGYTTEDLISATEDGILISGRGSWSIDQQRYNFQFGGQFFWEIKKGRLTRPLRDVAYQANTVEFWSSCDMLGGAGTYRLGGSFQRREGRAVAEQRGQPRVPAGAVHRQHPQHGGRRVTLSRSEAQALIKAALKAATLQGDRGAGDQQPRGNLRFAANAPTTLGRGGRGRGERDGDEGPRERDGVGQRARRGEPGGAGGPRGGAGGARPEGPRVDMPPLGAQRYAKVVAVDPATVKLGPDARTDAVARVAEGGARGQAGGLRAV